MLSNIKLLGLMIGLSTLTMTTAMANNVAVWNSQQAITNTNYAKAKLASIQASIKPKQQQLESYKANIERLQKQFAQQKDKLTDAQKEEIKTQIQKNLDNYTEVAQQIQTTIEDSETDIFQKISPKLAGIQETIIKQKNIDILIDNTTRVVNFVKPEWDVTAEFTKQINQQVK